MLFPHRTATPRRHIHGVVRAALRASAMILVLHLASALPALVARLIAGRGETDLEGIANFAELNESLWRGAAPTGNGYAHLAARGAAVIVDLRAEADLGAVRTVTDPFGLDVIHVPIRDGQTPTGVQLAEIAQTILSTDRIVFVHCGAGVGRTGTVVASRQISAGQSPGRALAEALSFGPLTIEQQAFIATASRSRTSFTFGSVVVSRIIDSPRRLWATLTA
jgi:protein tyrosine phosphatase (PTP) superfamily phosphohydrolase (DUF442 family)